MLDCKRNKISFLVFSMFFLTTACNDIFDEEESEHEILINADDQIGAVLFAEDENGITLNWREDNLYFKFFYEDGTTADVNTRRVNGVSTNNDILVKAADPEKNVRGISGRLEVSGSGSGYIVIAEGEVMEDDVDYFKIENELTRTDTFVGNDDLIEFEIGDVD